MRIVSLLPSGTEIVSALGFADNLVGRSHECDYPAGVEALPVVSEPAIMVSGSSQAIDMAVKDRLRKALSIYEVDAKRLAELAPDVVITQTQCDVCAVSPADVERALCDWADRSVNIVALSPGNLADVWSDFGRVAVALGVPERGDDVVSALQQRMPSVAPAHRPTLVTVEWIEPLMTAGNWMPELVHMAGGVQALGEAGKHSPFIDWQQLVDVDPDVLLISPCGFSIDRTMNELPQLTDKPGWNQLRAVRANRVFIADGNAYFHRPGPRLVDSAHILAKLLGDAPQAEGPGFVRFSA